MTSRGSGGNCTNAFRSSLEISPRSANRRPWATMAFTKSPAMPPGERRSSATSGVLPTRTLRRVSGEATRTAGGTIDSSGAHRATNL
eukprot:8437532-Lingulodinium_polyedra.AAC.1